MDTSDTSAFEASLSARGYSVVKRRIGPSEGLGDHAHDYDVWGLVTDGVFSISVDGDTRHYAAGEEFRLEAGCVHTEEAGPDGAALVVGRLLR